jgi:hypothetical protein
MSGTPSALPRASSRGRAPCGGGNSTGRGEQATWAWGQLHNPYHQGLPQDSKFSTVNSTLEGNSPPY